MRKAHVVTALLLVAVATPMIGQSTGTPVYAAPYRAFAKYEIGLSLSEPGAGYDLEGSYRTGLSRMDIGLRAGFHKAPNPGSTTTLLVGSDFRGRIFSHSESFPLDASFTLGLGFRSGQGHTVGMIPIGLSLGRRVLIENSNISLVPYIHPVLAPEFGDASGTPFSLGFGLDARITPRLDIRFSAAVGDHDGLAFTIAFLH